MPDPSHPVFATLQFGHDWEHVALQLGTGRSASATEQKYYIHLREPGPAQQPKKKRRKKMGWSGPMNEDGSSATPRNAGLKPAAPGRGGGGRGRGGGGRGRGAGRGSVGLSELPNPIDEYNRHEPVSRADIAGVFHTLPPPHVDVPRGLL